MSLVFALRGATLNDLWLYFLFSAGLSLIGVQLIVAWVQMQVLDALRIREQLAASDLRGKEVTAGSGAAPGVPAPAAVDTQSADHAELLGGALG